MNDSNSAKSPFKILIAEDNDSNYLLLKHLLRDFELTNVRSGAQAVEAMRNGDFSLVLMDIRMPEMNGLIATSKIREFNKDIAIIAITAHAFESDKIDAYNAGCNDFLAKPIKKEDLIEIINNYIK